MVYIHINTYISEQALLYLFYEKEVNIVIEIKIKSKDKKHLYYFFDY